MSWRRALKLVHLAGMGWFVLCVMYVLVSALRQVGVNWWVIFSLSGYSALLIFLLISLYLYAIFKGIDRSQQIAIEHPLTSSIYYAVFYDVSPFLGALAGCVGLIGLAKVSELLLTIALGTLATTFLVWIVVDPAIGFVERLLPASRKHRLERLARVRAMRQKRQEERRCLLDEILAREERDRQRWQQVLRSPAGRLAELLASNRRQAEGEAVDIGVSAWQMGGLSCMRQLHEMAMDVCRQKYQDKRIVDYIPVWWDGIGSWRTPSLTASN
jgi:hypothetical protein